MSDQIDRALLEAYSQGQMTRKEIEATTGQIVSFGRLLQLLHENGLRLPRVASDPESPGVQLVKQLAERRLQRP